MKRRASRPDDRVVIDLPREMPVEPECLPHAAMSLGGPAHAPRTAVRLVIEREGPFWLLYRLDAGGGFAGDTTHPSREDALHQAQREFQIDPDAYPQGDDET